MSLVRRAWLAPRPRRSARQRGQALVEFALFVPLLLFMVVGATDIATLLDNHLNVVYAARAGARVGSTLGNTAPSGAPYTADCAIIGAVQAALAGNRNVQVQWIAIYKADATGVYTSTLPQDIYPGTAMCGTGGIPTMSATTVTWQPTCRSAVPFAEDSIGVAIRYTYTLQFSPFANQFDVGGGAGKITDWAVMPIEVIENETAPPSC